MEGLISMNSSPQRFLSLILIGLAVLNGCTAMKTESHFEACNGPMERAASFYVLENFHALNLRLENRVAADLNAELSKRGLRIAPNSQKADIILVPTLGRIRTGDRHDQEPSTNLRSLETARMRLPSASAAGMTQARERSMPQTLSASIHTEPDWRVGLLLTAYDRKVFEEFDPRGKLLNPCWRTYACMSIDETSWQAASQPLIEAIAESVDANLR
jgi:hypothetical protein